MPTARSPLPAIVLLLLAGVFAGAQLGKIAPLIGWYRDGLGFSLVYVGWLTSTIALFVALAALPVSLAIDRIGQFRMLVVGSVALAAGGAWLAIADDPALILAARAIEGLGYLVLVIVLPAILNIVSPPAWRAPVLAMWGGFVPVGFAVADFSALALLPAVGEPAYLAVMVLAFAFLAVVAVTATAWLGRAELAPVRDAARVGIASSVTPTVLLVAGAFGLYVVVSIAFFAFLPAAAQRPGALLLVPAGVVALTVPLGNLLASGAMAGRGARMAAMLAAGGFAVTVATALPAYAMPGPATATVAIVVMAIAGGVTASALFACVPFIVPPGGSPSVVIGVICQSGGLTTLLAPPIAAYVIERAGWKGLGWFIVAVSLAGLAMLAPLLARRRGASAAGAPRTP